MRGKGASTFYLIKRKKMRTVRPLPMGREGRKTRHDRRLCGEGGDRKRGGGNPKVPERDAYLTPRWDSSTTPAWPEEGRGGTSS